LDYRVGEDKCLVPISDERNIVIGGRVFSRLVHHGYGPGTFSVDCGSEM
jgi:hypothetical protein